MKHRSNFRLNWRRLNQSVCLLIGILISAVAARAQTTPPPAPPLPVQPIYEQCETLSAGTAADTAIARAIASLTDKDPKVRAQAAQQLSQTCDRRAVEPLVRLLKDEDPLLRIAAVEALGQLGDLDSIESLIDVIYDKDWRVRLALARSLCSFRSFRARSMVLNGIASPRDGEITEENEMRVRCAAIIMLNQLKDISYSRKSMTFMFGYLQTSREPIRRIAEQTMFELKNTRNASYELIGILKQNNNPVLRRWAASWIGKLGIERGRAALEEAAIGDRDAAVRYTATEALALLKSDKEPGR
jgi:HEAT repeat protein